MLRDKTQKAKGKRQGRNLKIKIFEFLVAVSSFWFLVSGFVYAQEQFVYDAKGKRNPFIPLVSPDGRLLKLEKEEAPGNLAIEGIIYDKHGQSYAIVNGQVLRIGDEVLGYRVLKIEKNKVTFIKDGQPQEIELK